MARCNPDQRIAPLMTPPPGDEVSPPRSKSLIPSRIQIQCRNMYVSYFFPRFISSIVILSLILIETPLYRNNRERKSIAATRDLLLVLRIVWSVSGTYYAPSRYVSAQCAPTFLDLPSFAFPVRMSFAFFEGYLIPEICRSRLTT